MSTIRFVALPFVLLLTLLFSLLGCRPSPPAERARELIAQANNLLDQDVKITGEWAGEYGRLFSPQNRAKFPSNRESLRSRGESLVRLINESTRLNTGAAEKFEQAAGLISGDKEKRGLNSVASSLRKNIEINALMKEQMVLASDEGIKDQKIFNEKFMTLMSLIQQKTKERDEQQAEGKKLMGW